MRRWLASFWRAWKFYQGLRKLLTAPVYDAVRYSVRKTQLDSSFSNTEDHGIKRKEAEEWARHYAREHGIDAAATWAVNLLIEYHVGHLKGRV